MNYRKILGLAAATILFVLFSLLFVPVLIPIGLGLLIMELARLR